MSSDFVHLHVHTEFSLLDGQSQITDLVNRAAELEMPAVGITDHGVMFGVMDFYRAAKKAGLKPVIGMEAYLAPRKLTDKDAKLDKRPYHMLLLAKNQTGYKNLMKLASIAQLEGYYYRPRIDSETMAQYSEGLIATSGCLAAEIPRMVEEGREDDARQKIGWYLDVFGADNFYLELQPHDIDQLGVLNQWLHDYRKSGHTSVEFLATNDVHYVRRDDWDAHDTLLCIQTGSHKTEDNRMRMNPHDSYYLKTSDEMFDEFKRRGLPDDIIRESFANSLKVAEMTHLDLEVDDYRLPVFPVPERFNDDAGAYLRYLVEMGLSWRYPGREDERVLQERMNRELDIIGSMGFNTYFLIVWDLCEFARHADIWWNVRGSGAGSLVAYCLGITNIDPIQNSLLFERFLNPGRVSMPDIDLDYPDNRRAEMIAYTADKYGKDKVAAIITFGTMGAKASVKDVGRALNVELAKINHATGLIPQEARQKQLQEYIENNPELHQLYDQDDEVQQVMDTAKKLQGMTRHASTHAAGVIVADRPLDEYVPLHRITGTDPSGGSLKAVTQFPMETAESIGLLKVDFLGLSTLTILRKACDLINRHHGTNYTIDTIPYRHDDSRNPLTDEQLHMLDEAFELMGRGETVGVFQVESPGMQSMLRGMRPRKFENIIAGISLYRPGPMEFIPQYNARLHRKEEVPYKHEALEPILEETYGIFVYQEQIMQVAGELFGYELGEADLMRRAVSKKKAKALAEHRAIFMERGPENGISEDIAEEIFDEIEFFANYGFNKCLIGSTQIVDAQTGRIVTIDDLYQQNASVHQTITCDTDSLNLQPGQITDVIYNGVKPVYRLTTRTGRTITATGNHPFYTFDGWRNLDDLTPGDKIAVPRRLPVEGTQEWSHQEIDEFVENFIDLDELPDSLFELNNASLSEVIGKLLAKAGFWTKKQHALLIGTGKERIARQMQHLLSRAGIISRINIGFIHTEKPVTDNITVDLIIEGENNLNQLLRVCEAYLSQNLSEKISQAIPVSATDTGILPSPEDDVYRDEIVSIEYAGEEPTYDLTIADTHNFIANDILVHNSHATDYAVITVQSAFLKQHYPHEFMTALLCVQFDDSEKVSTFLEECRRLNIEVLPPHINNSQIDFDIEEQPDGTRGIRFGMGAIKNAGVNALQHIIDEREANGAFESLTDFCQRVDLSEVGKRALESLIKVGALAGFGKRDDLLAMVERIVGFSASHHKAKAAGQMSFFGGNSGLEEKLDVPRAPVKEHFSRREQLGWEKELLGLYVTGRPVDKHRDKFRVMSNLSIVQHLTDPDTDVQQDRQVKIAGEIVTIRELVTKNNRQMAILHVEDWHESAGTIDVVMFPRKWQQTKAYVRQHKEAKLSDDERTKLEAGDIEAEDLLKLAEGDIVVIQGEFDISRDAPQILGNNISFEFENLQPDDIIAQNRQYAYQHPVPDSTQSEMPPPPDEHYYDDANYHTSTDHAASDAAPQEASVHTAPADSVSGNGNHDYHNANGNGNGAGGYYPADASDNTFDDLLGLDKEEKRDTIHIDVHFQKSDDPERDRRKLQRIHRTMIEHPGENSFSIIIEGNPKATIIDFPNHTTGYSEALLHDLVDIVGKENIHIHDIQATSDADDS